MKKLSLVCALLLLVSGASLLIAEDGSWTGEVLDMKCYETGKSGEGHAGCAATCLGKGGDMGLLVEGDVVMVDREGSDAEAIKALEKLGGHMAKVTGSASEMDGKAVVKVKTAEKAG